MKKLLTTLMMACLLLGPFYAQADKPEWAGEGGKPSDAEKRQHVEEMQEKNEEKGEKKGKDKKKDKDKKDSEWEKERKKLEDNVRANNRGMIGSRPLN